MKTRKEKLFEFVVNNKTNCYRAFKKEITHKGFRNTEGKLLVELARKELNYSTKTWDGDIYVVLWRTYRKIIIEGNDK